MNKDVNTVVENQIKSMIITDAVSNEIKIVDGKYIMTITIEKMDEE